MSNKTILKEYLLTSKKKTPFLLDDNNNGKTIMLSGAWGAGKTHFWQNEIEPTLSTQLKGKDKTSVYVSLYGKDSLESLKKEIYLNAFSQNKLISKEVSTFGFDVLSTIKNSDLAIGKTLKAFNNLIEFLKKDKGSNRLKDGGVICLDDFERKSTKIGLNDLFGFISQLALDMNCKVVIILNSDVFIGKEAEVFRNVKEKTVSKFFYFEPTIEELFRSISNHKKYNNLEKFKVNILNTILETEVLNARIYIQVLDNCLEWLEVKEKLDENIIRVLVLGTFNFVSNHMVLDWREIKFENERISNTDDIKRIGMLSYLTFSFYSNTTFKNYNKKDGTDKVSYLRNINKVSEENFLKTIKLQVTQVDKNNTPILSEKNQEEHLNWIKENELKLKALWKYGYRLYYVTDVEEELYIDLANFIKTGILI